MPRVRLALLVALAVVAVVAVACDDEGQVVTGIVLDVQQSGPTAVTGFTFRTDDGQVLIFRVGDGVVGDPSFPGIHLRDHMASAERVAVRYVETDEGPLAIRLADAPRATAPPTGAPPTGAP